MQLGTTKEMKALVKQAKSQGWSITVRTCGHLRWTSPVGTSVFTSRTPSDKRAIQKIKRDLRLKGFIEIKKHN